MNAHCLLRVRNRSTLAPLLLTALILSMLTIGVANAGSSGPKVVILELHGMKQGIIDESLEGLPHFQELIRGPRNAQAYVYLPRVFVTIPAASVPGISSMYTGLYPQRTGVVSTIWFDRRTTKVRTMVSYFQQRINRILTSNGVKSLFDYVGESGRHSMTTMLMLTKGADWSVKSGASFWGNASLLGLLRNGRWFPDSPYVDQKTISAFLTGHVLSYDKSLSGIQQYQGIIPDVMVVQLLGIPLPKGLDGNNPLRNLHDNLSRFRATAAADPDISIPQ